MPDDGTLPPAPGRAARLLHHLAVSAGREALCAGGRSYTFGDLDRLSRRYAAGLARLGVRRGDRVAVFADGAPELVVALLGHYRLGAVHVPVNTRYRAEEAGHVLADSGASAVVCAAGSECEAVLDAIGPLPGLAHRLLLGGTHPGAVPFEALLADDLDFAAPLPGDDDDALIIYTSGTTGRSKGVELSFRAVVDNVEAVTRLWGFSSADRLALTLPLFHVHGLGLGVHGTLLHGAALLLADRFDAGWVVDAFGSHGATVFMGVPTMYVRLLERIGADPAAAAALSRARLFTAGSAPLPADDFRAFEAATSHRILERYGMSETLFTLSNPYDGERRPGSVGLPVPGCAVRLVDEAGADVPDGELGEIIVGSSGIMTRYRGLPAETAASFRDGWFLTGDVARRDADGYVTIVGRRSVDVIKSGGFKISAREIEDVLRRHPLVDDVAVVGAPDRTWGQRIVAAVTLAAPEAAPAPDALLAELSRLAAANLAEYKRPRGVVVLPELPRNALGKVQKHLVLEAVAAAGA